jgi:hypothetical protein
LKFVSHEDDEAELDQALFSLIYFPSMKIWMYLSSFFFGATFLLSCANPQASEQQGLGVHLKDGDGLLPRDIAIDPSKDVVLINPEVIAQEIHVLINKY